VEAADLIRQCPHSIFQCGHSLLHRWFVEAALQSRVLRRLLIVVEKLRAGGAAGGGDRTRDQ